MDDLEKAILLVYEPGAADPTFRAQAMAFCDRAKADLSALLRLCLDRLHRSPLVPVHFWCLQALHDAVRLRYSSFPPADLPILRSALLSLASDRPLPAASPPFLRNKLAQTLAALIRLEYPSPWPDPFLRILPCLPSADPSSIDMFARFLVALDDDLLSLDYPRSSAEAADAARVKDSMRQQCVPQIARHWFDVVSLYHSLDTYLAAAALDTMRRYVTWIDIALVANDAFVPLLFELILAPDSIDQLRAAAVGCVLAILQKRMDPRQKVALLRSLPVNRVFADPNLVIKVPYLVTGYAAEVLECYKKLGLTHIDSSSPMELLEEALPSVFYVMQESEEVELGNVVEFLSDYVTTMRTPSQKQAVYLGHILEFIRVQICYDPAYRNNLDIPDKIGREEEDQMGERRKDLLVLFCVMTQPDMITRGSEKKREKKNLEFVDPSPAGDYFSWPGEKKRLPAWGEGTKRRLKFRAIGRYIPVRQFTDTRTTRYRAVPPKIDRRRSISAMGDRLREKSTVGRRLREIGDRRKREEEEEEEKKKRRRNRTSTVAAHGSPACCRRPHSRAIFLPREETKRLPARGERSRRRKINKILQNFEQN
ncbi:hypothetical protein BHM03_00007071 [Ensete ventricosum]|nr:hypothetical protein BHM03_00007071 [Ensete ventricosum]